MDAGLGLCYAQLEASQARLIFLRAELKRREAKGANRVDTPGACCSRRKVI